MKRNNPYSRATVVDLSESEQALYRPAFSHVPDKNDKIHTVREWDNVWDIAGDYYGDSHYYFLIADINRLESPFELPAAGKTIIIPSMDPYRKYL